MEPTQSDGLVTYLLGKRHVDRSFQLTMPDEEEVRAIDRISCIAWPSSSLLIIPFFRCAPFAEPELHAELHEQRMCPGTFPRRLLCRLPIPRAAGLALAGRTGAHIAAKRLDFARHLESGLAEDSRDGGLDE